MGSQYLGSSISTCADAVLSQASAESLAKYSADGLAISPVTYGEMASAFGGDAALQEHFLAAVGLNGRPCERSTIRKQRTLCGQLIFRKNKVAISQNAHASSHP